jgi:hypothetical protein
VPFFFDTNVSVTSNGSANTETDHLRFLTAANQETAKLVGLYGASRFGTAGGAQLRVKTFGTASTVGSAATPAKRHPSSPAASLTAFTGPTAGATPTVRLTVGLAQTGGTGGWVALEPMAAISLLANAGANGNADVFSICNAASVPLDFTVEHSEG